MEYSASPYLLVCNIGFVAEFTFLRYTVMGSTECTYSRETGPGLTICVESTKEYSELT